MQRTPVIAIHLTTALDALVPGQKEHQRPPQVDAKPLSVCSLGSGAFTLLPQRHLGQLSWGQWFGLA